MNRQLICKDFQVFMSILKSIEPFSMGCTEIVGLSTFLGFPPPIESQEACSLEVLQLCGRAVIG